MAGRVGVDVTVGLGLGLGFGFGLGRGVGATGVVAAELLVVLGVLGVLVVLDAGALALGRCATNAAVPGELEQAAKPINPSPSGTKPIVRIKGRRTMLRVM